MLCCGTERRNEFICRFAELAAALADFASKQCSLPVLRTYWYDAAPRAVAEPDQARIAALPNVKLRLGRLVAGKQKGVDSLIVRDFMTLARERAIATAYLLAGDEDLREGVVAAQEMGVRVVVLGIPTTGQGNQADTLIQEADEHVMLPAAFWSNYFSRVDGGAAVAHPAEPAVQTPVALEAGNQVPEGERARRVGLAFGQEWAQGAGRGEVEELLRQAPRIPTELDVPLILEAEKTLGSLRERQDLKRDLRAGFWNALRNFVRPPAPAR